MCALRDTNGDWTPDEPNGLVDSNGSDEDDTFYDSDWFSVMNIIDIVSYFKFLGYVLLMIFSLFLLSRLIDQIWSLAPGESAGILAGVSLLALLVFLYIVNFGVIKTNLDALFLDNDLKERSPDSTNENDRIDFESGNVNVIDGDFGWMADGDFF